MRLFQFRVTMSIFVEIIHKTKHGGCFVRGEGLILCFTVPLRI